MEYKHPDGGLKIPPSGILSYRKLKVNVNITKLINLNQHYMCLTQLNQITTHVMFQFTSSNTTEAVMAVCNDAIRSRVNAV